MVNDSNDVNESCSKHDVLPAAVPPELTDPGCYGLLFLNESVISKILESRKAHLRNLRTSFRHNVPSKVISTTVSQRSCVTAYNAGGNASCRSAGGSGKLWLRKGVRRAETKSVQIRCRTFRQNTSTSARRISIGTMEIRWCNPVLPVKPQHRSAGFPTPRVVVLLPSLEVVPSTAQGNVPARSDGPLKAASIELCAH